MLFKLLKLFGLDIPAKVAAAKSAIEQRAEEVADYAKEATQTAAVIAALSVLAGISGAMALGVGLLEVYRLVAESFGVNTGLGVVAGVFVAVAVILLLIAWAKEQSLANRRIFKALTPSPAAASSSAPVAAAEGPASASPGAGGPRPEPARDLLEPLAFLLAKYVRYPPWEIQCWMNSWEACGPRHAEPPTRRWSGRQISYATAIGASYSSC